MNFLRKLITNKFFLFALLLVGGIVLFAPQVFAQGDTFGINRVGGLLPLGGEDIRVIIAKIIRIFLSLLGIIAVGLMLYAGFTWMTSGGNEEKIASAKKILINATIGLAIIMSSFAITQFILKSLSDVTGGDANGGNGGVNGGPVGACENFADCQANAGAQQCGDGEFVVKSLTPRTPNNNGTGMTNTIIRAVFSRPLDPGQNPNQIFRLTSGGNPVAVRNVRILNGRQIVEAYFERSTDLCNAGDERGCLTPGEYTIEVNPELSANGVKLKTRLSCGDFDNRANFNVNQDFLDNQAPAVSSLTFHGRRSGANIVVGRNAKYRLNATFEDRKRNPQNVAFGGISYAHLRVQSEPRDADGERVDWSYYDGPKSGSNEAFSFGRDLVFASNTPAPALYTLTFNYSDIDSNRSVATSSFILVGELCNNGRQDPGETAVDIGGACLDDGQCNADWQCLAGECGADGRCVNRPVIKNVDVGGPDPDAWDGAPGSWATIIGNFFGEQNGTVEFGVDGNNDGTIDQWVGAPFANCNGIDVWSDRQIIVEIPNIPRGTSTTIRVRTPAVGERPAYEDLSTDDHGPKSGPYEGIFKMSDNNRPGLCAVLGPNNTNMASSSAPVSAFGRALGNGQNSGLLFGAVAAPIRQWGDQTILSSVPQNMRPGRVGVRAKIGDNFTNGVEFVVIDRDANVVPQLNSISPYPTSTRGSLVTLGGAGFGAHGTVFMAANRQAAVACAEAADAAGEAACKKLDLLTLPAACGNTWSDKQIIGKIPTEDIQLGQYFFVVKNDAGYHSDGARELTIVDGAPLPGLCRLEPNSGVAPLPADADALSITGINLNPNPELYFWSVGSTWLISSRDRDPQGDNVIRDVAGNGTNIKTVLPVGNNGVSMITGPILARVGGNFSNSVQYTVNDCTLGGDAPGANYQCCTTGPEKGVWKPAGFACAGETRSAGYIWRFTTGLIPQVPRVLEACNVEEWDNLAIENFVRPSPSPWQSWNVGDACTDSVITVQFNMRMSEANLADQVKVYTCGQGASPDCSYDEDTDVSENYRPTFLPGQNDVLEMRLENGATHATGTWHRVILGNNIRANEPGVLEFGQNKVNTSQLSLQRPLDEAVNGVTAAYHFDFKTGVSRCSLFGAAITPPTYTTRLLGVVQNTAYPISTNFDNPPHPFYFYVWGRGKQACSVINVNGQGWEWKPRRGNAQDEGSDFAYTTKSDNAEAQGVAPTSTQYYKDVRATATALQNTLLTPVYLTASTNTVVDGVNKQVVGTSTLFIQLGDPTVTEWWPECSESCTNATIGVRFNLPMVTSTYRTANGSAIRIEKCLGLGENCESTELIGNVNDVNPGAFDPFEYAITVPGNLSLGTLYQVTVTDQILSFGGTLNGQTIIGKPLVPKVWKFRTKMKDGICILDKVDVLPSPYVATLVGQKTPYAASPLSSPNQCSSTGQRLNPWAYGWNWSVQNEEVASITDFATKGTPPGFCSTNCLPTGSDVPLGQTAFTCGNGTVDPGEDCDIAIPGETPGTSCSLSCLRPGNMNATTTANPASVGLCGNGALEPNFGEECDPGIPGLKPYCTNTCTWTGSDNRFTGDVNDLQCGNGFIGLGEDGLAVVGEECDTGISLEAARAEGQPQWSRLGCSDKCLHEGTRLARSYCERDNINPDHKASAACYNAITICGNGQLEHGEECERNPNDNTHITVFGPNGVPTLINVASATSTCSNRCVLKNVCDIRNAIHSDFTCAAATPGCSRECTRLGSSPLYEPASLCGDGATGLGENPRCEPAELAEREGNDQDPIQIVTAVGRAEPNPQTMMQETTISAQATQVRESDVTTTPLRDRNIRGVGNYALQCGFVEYAEPQVDNGVVSANNCPDQTQGVDKNSCCQPRPTRVAEYPVHGTGIGNNNLVCQNTFISAEFDHEIDPATVQNAVRIASLHPAGYNCATQNETDITADVNTLLAFENANAVPQGVLAKIWDKMKDFFVSIFESVVHAHQTQDLAHDIEHEINGKVWCTGKISTQNTVYPRENEDGTPNGSLVSIVINNILDPQTTYVVILRGGNAGIKDVGGVSIRGQGLRGEQDRYYKDDAFVFKTSNQICKISSVSVQPAAHLFTAPTSTRQFRTVVNSTSGGPIVSTPSYSWEWNWVPQNNDVFRLVAPVNRSDINISSTGLEGSLTAAAQATITQDSSEVGSEVGKIYVGLTELTSNFCENPWPSQALYPYEDKLGNRDNFNQATKRFDGRVIPGISLGGKTEYLNFGFGYCADAGAQGRKSDDLPFLQPVVKAASLAVPGSCSITGAACNQDSDCPDVQVRGRFFIRPQDQTCKPGRVENDDSLSPGTLKQFLLFNDLNKDIIGIQIFENPEQLSSRDWFVSKGFSGIERYRDVVFDGYTGISDGNNIYISALNELSDKRVHSYIYLFGINENAQTNTRQVFDKIMRTLKFNINIPERNNCVVGNGTSGGQYLPANLQNIAVTSISCVSDYGCRNEAGVPTSTSNGLCANAKTKFQSDWKRLNLVRDIQNKLETFKAANNGQYPSLQAGTYIPGYTNTHWPSWNRFLEAVGSVPNPPLNEWAACGRCSVAQDGRFGACSTNADCGANGTCVLPDDPQTCWNSTEGAFSCPLLSNVLEYEATNNSTRYELYLPLEYFSMGQVAQKDIIGRFASTTSYNPTASCGLNGVEVVQAAAGTCGNGIRNAGEQCDPAGSSVSAARELNCPAGQTAFKTCNERCQYDAPVCRPAATCGNGRVEGNELCDDGNLNGTYGRCSRNCTPPQRQTPQNPENAGFCGDEVRNFNDVNRNGRQDAGEGFVEACDKNQNSFLSFGFCEFNLTKECTGDFLDIFGNGPKCGANEGDCISKSDPTYHISPQYSNNTPASCSADCQSVGGFCGDGQLQRPFESCDDGNRNLLDGCSNTCQVENISCIRALPAQNIQTVNGNTHITINYPQNPPASCSQTNGDAICRGLGLACDNVLSEEMILDLIPAECQVGDFNCDRAPRAVQRYEYRPMGLGNFSRACERDLTSDINKNVKVECTGVPANAPAAAVQAGSCGNGQVNEGEVCDTGANNGRACSPEYGRTCTYCSADCREVLTVDPVAACGNGKIDVDGRRAPVNGVFQPEVCDINPQTNEVVILNLDGYQFPPNSTQVIYQVGYNSHTVPAQCGDQGTFSCEDSCQRLVNNCVNCTTSDAQGEPIPKISVLNVLTPLSNQLNHDWAGWVDRNLIRLNAKTDSGVRSLGGSGGWGGKPAGVHENNGANVLPNDRWRNYVQGYNTSNHMNEQWILGTMHGYPLDRGYGFRTSSNRNGPWSNTVREFERGVESNLLCKDQYALYFNLNEATTALGGQWNNAAPVLHAAGAKAQYERYGSFFPYPVNNEVRVVQNEYVLSPAVPQGTFRVVVKWKDPNESDVIFAPIVYNQDFLTPAQAQSQDASVRFQSTVTYSRALAEARRPHPNGNFGANATWVCSKMAQHQAANYWLPFDCIPFHHQGAAQMGEGNLLVNKSGGVYVHAPGELRQTKAMAMTIFTGNHTGTAPNGVYDSPYAVFIEAISGEGSLPISAFDNMDVTVEVYDYRNDQIPESSLFQPRPTNVFSIRSARSSGNEGLTRYWHAFNLVKSGQNYQIRPIADLHVNAESYPQGAIVTSFADVLCRVPGENCNRDQ